MSKITNFFKSTATNASSTLFRNQEQQQKKVSGSLLSTSFGEHIEYNNFGEKKRKQPEQSATNNEDKEKTQQRPTTGDVIGKDGSVEVKRPKIFFESTASAVSLLSTASAGTLPRSVEILLESMNKDASANGSTIGWYDTMTHHFRTKSFEKLATFVLNERQSCNVPIYPPVEHTWTALNECPLEHVKVVIVGQDPYHGPNQAHGLCFSVLPGVRPLPPSLLNIYKEIASDSDVSVNFTTQSLPKHGHLIKWSRQGVLLLNTVMTVRRGQPNSHQKQGWEAVTDEIIKSVVKYNSNKGIVFLLWGKPAFSKATNVLNNYGESAVNSNKNEKTKRKNKVVVISTSHPSPLGASKTASPFTGSRCFSKCNQALVQMGLDPIDWNVD